jgi:alpha-L-fucosidase
MGYNAYISPKDYWFSKKDNNLYITSLKWTENKDIQIESLTRLTKDEISNIESVKLLGCEEKIGWSMAEKGLIVTLPSIRPNIYCYVLKITFRNS